MPKQIDIRVTKVGPNDFTVEFGGKFADRLTRGEALEACACLLFNPALMPPYFQAYEQWLARQQRRGAVPAAVAALAFHPALISKE